MYIFILQAHDDVILKQFIDLDLVGCFGFNGPLRQYFSLYRAVSQREGERRERIEESKMSKPPPPAPTASAIGPYPIDLETLHHFGCYTLQL